MLDLQWHTDNRFLGVTIPASVLGLLGNVRPHLLRNGVPGHGACRTARSVKS